MNGTTKDDGVEAKNPGVPIFHFPAETDPFRDVDLGRDPVQVRDLLAISLSFARHRLTLPLAKAARRFLLDKAWFSFGYARLDDHARERFGRSGRWVRDLGALAEASERLPDLGVAVGGEDGKRPIGSVLALLIGKTATLETCDDWIALARRLTVREFREEIRTFSESGALSTATESGADTAHEASAESSGLSRTGSESGSEPDERCTIRFAVPPPVRAAFEEARDLYSAVSGGETSLTSFVEALVADACAGPTPPLYNEPHWHSIGQASREQALAAVSEGWASLREKLGDVAALAEADATLQEVRRLCLAAEENAGDADELIRSLVHLDDEIERRLGQILAYMSEVRAWPWLQFSGVGHYGEERLGISRTTAEDRARLARSLRERPVVREAYETGQIGSEAAALILRVLHGAPADAWVETVWAEHAAQTSIKRLRDEVRLLGREEDVDLRRGVPAPPDDETWHNSISRRLGLATARIERYGKAAAAARFEIVTLGLRLPLDLAADLLAAVKARRSALEKVADEFRRQHEHMAGGMAGQNLANMWSEFGESQRAALAFPLVAGAADGSSTLTERLARTFSIHNPFLPEWVGLLGLLEDFVRTWDDPRQAPKRPSDQIYIRDGWRCSAPGCSSRQNLQDHHIVYRSQGGSDDLHNRTTLCVFHHQRGEHGDLLECRGEAPLGIAWKLGRAGIGGTYRNEIVRDDDRPALRAASTLDLPRGRHPVGESLDEDLGPPVTIPTPDRHLAYHEPSWTHDGGSPGR